MLYELRQYDTPLLTFKVERKELDNFVFDVNWVDEKNKYLLPIGMTADSDGLSKWLKSRVVPKNREFVDQILAKSGLARNDVMGIINVCKGLSLNDSYWVVEHGFEGKFEDYNLYQNNFTRTLALIAYTGYGSNSKRGFTSSPEYTTARLKNVGEGKAVRYICIKAVLQAALIRVMNRIRSIMLRRLPKQWE